ncbi:hypothetical protein LEMLEM_LOCUS559 [Lemmus lemmus]
MEDFLPDHLSESSPSGDEQVLAKLHTIPMC